MAVILPFPPGADDVPAFFWGVSSPVGPGCPNLAEDVRVVQWLLMMLYTDPLLTPPVDQDLDIDGACGPITCAYILGFQKEAVRKGIPVKTDGRVDPVTLSNWQLQGSVSHTYYTILSLNTSVYRRFPEMYGGTTFDNLPVFLTAIRQRGLQGALYSGGAQ